MTDDLRTRVRALEAELADLRAELDRPAATTSSRRHLLRAAAVGAAGAVGAATLTRAAPAAAATGGAVILGQANTADAVTSIENNGPFPDLNAPGPIALELRSPGAHLRFVGAVGDAIRGAGYPDGTLAYNGGAGLVLWTGGDVVRLAAAGTAPIHLLPQPVRLHDSRNGPQLGSSASGRLVSGANRVINIGFSEGESNDLGQIASFGAMVNVTIVDTIGSGFLTVCSPTSTPPPTSNINWTQTGQTMANMAITRLDEASLQLWAGGGGSCHVVVDVMALLG